MKHSEVYSRLMSEFSLGTESVHGPQHWKRVEAYGLYLAHNTGANPILVSLFAHFHDCRRVNEHHDPGHGLRGGEYARQLEAELGLPPDDLETLFQACAGHTDLVYSHDPTIATCWDADRLDLDRVGAVTDPRFLSTEAGKELCGLSPEARWERVGLGVRPADFGG